LPFYKPEKENAMLQLKRLFNFTLAGKTRVPQNSTLNVETGGQLQSNGAKVLIDAIVGVVTGTVSAAKALIVDASKNLTGLNNLTITGLFFESATNGITAFAGGGQGSAVALTTEVNRVTTVATSGDSVKLPAATAGLTIVVVNKGANPLAVFPAAGDAIDGLAANASVTQMQSSMVIYSCAVAGQWDSEGLATGYSGSYQTLSVKNGVVAHAGGTQAGAIGDAAAQIPAMLNRITTVVTAADSVVLPTAVPGMSITIANGAANSANVFPFTGDAINALGANAAFALAGGKTAAFECMVAGQWHAILSA
jgi:hypothetical protein